MTEELIEKSLDPELLAISALDILDELGKKQKKVRGRNPVSTIISPKFFQRCEVYHPAYMEWYKKEDKNIYFDLPLEDIDDPFFRLRTPFDCSIISEELETGGLAFTRYREQRNTNKRLRGKLTAFPRHIIEISELYSNPHKAFRYYAGWINGKWMDINQRKKDRKVQEFWNRDMTLHTCLAAGIQAEREFSWSISIGLPDSGSVSFITKPTALKELFRLREIPKGKRRREQLLTWVRYHWRRKPPKEEQEEASVYVRAHLRGAESFLWEDFVCRIHPSIDDLDENTRLKIMREKGCLP